MLYVLVITVLTFDGFSTTKIIADNLTQQECNNGAFEFAKIMKQDKEYVVKSQGKWYFKSATIECKQQTTKYKV